jgi:protein-tyrosine phosphatase
MIDLHNHMIPGVDDGASDLAEALKALREMRAQDVTRIVATPHVDGSLGHRPDQLAERLAEIDDAWQRLVAAVGEAADMPTLARGAEIKLDTPEPILADARLRLAGTGFVLVEFPFMSVPPQSARAVTWIRGDGYVPIIAHPERYHGIERMQRALGEWRTAGAYFQVNCGSLLGRYGPEVKRVAMTLLRYGWIDYLASDSHARGPMPHAETARLLDELDAGDQAKLLLQTNPSRLLASEAPLPVAPVAIRTGVWQRFVNVFR